MPLVTTQRENERVRWRKRRKIDSRINCMLMNCATHQQPEMTPKSKLKPENTSFEGTTLQENIITAFFQTYTFHLGHLLRSSSCFFFFSFITVCQLSWWHEKKMNFSWCFWQFSRLIRPVKTKPWQTYQMVFVYLKCARGKCKCKTPLELELNVCCYTILLLLFLRKKKRFLYYRSWTGLTFHAYTSSFMHT